MQDLEYSMRSKVTSSARNRVIPYPNFYFVLARGDGFLIDPNVLLDSDLVGRIDPIGGGEAPDLQRDCNKGIHRRHRTLQFRWVVRDRQ